MVNLDVMGKIRGDIKCFAEESILFNYRGEGVPAGGTGRGEFIEGDFVIMATGFERLSLNFLPAKTFIEPYNTPNWYF